MSAVADLYPKPGEFERLLEDAENGMHSQWDETFIEDLKDRHARYGSQLELSTRQVEQLERLANQ